MTMVHAGQVRHIHPLIDPLNPDQHNMIRQRKFYGNFTERPPSRSPSNDDGSAAIERPRKKRKANLYDAVAGKQSSRRLLFE